MVNITPITNDICILLGQHIRQSTLNEMLKSLDGKKPRKCVGGTDMNWVKLIFYKHSLLVFTSNHFE